MNGTASSNLPQRAHIDASDIPWELAPLARVTTTTFHAVVPDDALGIVAMSETQLLERVADLTEERDRYQELARTTIHALADLQARHDRQQARYHELLEECRTLRTQRAA